DLHDERTIYARQVAAARTATSRARHGVRDWYAFTLSFKGVLLEGLEVVFIAITFGANQQNLGLAAAGAATAVGAAPGLRIGGRGRRDRRAGAAVAGPGEHHEVRRRRHADLVRRVLGRGGRRGVVAGPRRRPARHSPGDRPGRAGVHGPAAPGARGPGRGACR